MAAAKLTDLSNSGIVFNIFIVCRHVIRSKCAVIDRFYSYVNTVCCFAILLTSTFRRQLFILSWIRIVMFE